MIYKHIRKLSINVLVISCLLSTYGCRRKPEEVTPPPTTPTKTTTANKKHNNHSTPTPQPTKPIVVKHKTVVSSPQPKKQTKLFTKHTELLAWLKKIDSIENRQQKTVALNELGKDIGTENFNNALILAKNISDSFARIQVYKGIFEAQTAIDPLNALTVAETLIKPSNSGKSIHRNDYQAVLLIAIKGVAMTDPDTAMSHLSKIKSGSTRQHAMIAVYEGWGQLDQDSALESAAQHSIQEQNKIVPAIFKGWALDDPFAAANYAGQLENSPIKQRILENIAQGFFISQWDENNLAAITESVINDMPKSMHKHIIPRIYEKWADISPATAAEHYLANHKGPLTVRDRTLNNILRGWAKTDPSGAAKWADTIVENDKDYVALIRTITSSLRHKNPKQVATILEELPFTFADNTAGSMEVFHLMTSWTKKNPKEAIEWVNSLNNRQLKIIATKSIASNMVTKDYQKTFEWAENIQDSDMQAYAFSNIALKQSLTKMKKSDEWIESLPSGFVKTRTAASYALGALWRAKDHTAAMQFKQQLSDDELNPPQLITILENSNLPEKTRNRMIELLE